MPSTKLNLSKKSFSLCVRTQGKKIKSSGIYVFSTPDELKSWLSSNLVKIEDDYGPVELYISSLDNLKVGDTCYVIGEGLEQFKIEDIRKLSDYVYSFGVNDCWEPVSKCHRYIRTSPNEKNNISQEYLSLVSQQSLRKIGLKSTVSFRY